MYEILCFFMPILGIAWFVVAMKYFNRRYSVEMNRREKVVMCGLKTVLVISVWIRVEIGKYSLQSMICFLYIDVLLGTFLLIAWIDYRKKIIPDALNVFLMCIGLMVLVMSVNENKFYLKMGNSLINILMIPLTERVKGLLILSVPLILINMIYPGGFGGGDVKFLAAAGFNLGFTRIVYGTLIGSFLAAIVCIVLLSFGKIKRREKIAFGPFLCVGAMIVVLGG